MGERLKFSFNKKFVSFTSVFLLSFGFCDISLIAFGEHVTGGERGERSVSLSDISTILNYADAELESSGSFLAGLDDIALVIAQPDVIRALKNNNKVESDVRKLRLPSRIAALLKKAFKATRKPDAPGVEYKRDVANLLVGAYSLWSDEDALQKLNFERWSDQLLDELDIKKHDACVNVGKTDENNLFNSQTFQKTQMPKVANVEKVVDFSKDKLVEVTRLPEGIKNIRDARKAMAGMQKRRIQKKPALSDVVDTVQPRKPSRSRRRRNSSLETENHGRKGTRPAWQKRKKNSIQEGWYEQSQEVKARKGNVGSSYQLNRRNLRRNTMHDGRKPRTEHSVKTMSRRNSKQKAANGILTNTSSYVGGTVR